MGRAQLADAAAIALVLLCVASSIGLASALPVDLTNDNFDERVRERPADSWVLVDFFASWCPACKRFAPIYEAVSDEIGSSSESGNMYVARADCATETVLCNRFKLKGYPSVFLGRPASFAEGAEREPIYYGGGRDKPQSVVEWVAKETGRNIKPGARTGPEGPDGVIARSNSTRHVAAAQPRPTGEAQRLDLTDVVSATVASFRATVDNPALMKGVESRQALKDYLDLLATAHPVKQCRAGAESAEGVLSKVWPNASQPPKAGAFAKSHVCGKHFKEQDWGSCRGSSPGTRGYTCALWLLFHSLAAHVTGDTGGALWMAAVKGFMQNFFPCDDCSGHFAAMAAEDDAVLVQSPDDALLWSWRAHNRVNARVRKDEADSGDGDVAFPKVQWPTPEMCPSCHVAAGGGGSDWDEAAVLSFLKQYYGDSGGLPLHKDRWHMQLHRKAAFARSERFRGSMLHGKHSRATSALFWLLLVGVLIVVVKTCSAQSRSPAGSSRGGNGKFRHY